ncbi:MAG: hypothetical protein R3258_03875 [Acidimicrobiia bacterium]|nr:hypothetical protein [Acidimicrobiia bacterium]
MSETRRRFFKQIRRRIRFAWLTATAQQLGPYLGLLLVLLFFVDWLTAWDDAALFSLAAVGGFVFALVVGSLSLRITDWDASRAAERGLHARDALTTALEFNDPEDEVHQAIQREADSIAASSDAAVAIPVEPRPDRLRQVALAAAAALVLAFIPPFSDTPALSVDVQTALEKEAEQLEQIADAIEAQDLENKEELAEELRRLAEELRTAQTLEEALEALEKSEKRLDALKDPNALAQKAAVQGLASDLALRPLVDGTSLDASTQLEELAKELDQLSEPELRALQDRLGELAASQAAGNPDLASQLSEAASALQSGNLAAASQALSDAAASQTQGVSQARGQQAISEVQGALAAVSSRLSGEGTPTEGNGGAGEGQGGEGQEGSQGGAGQGQGGQSGGASPGGEISDVAPGSGDASGQGGQGTVGTGEGDDHGTEVDTSSVYDPAVTGPAADLLQVHISGGGTLGDVTALKDTETQEGEAIVPYATVLPQYLNEAADALAALRLPPGMRTIVQSYFDRLAQAAQ